MKQDILFALWVKVVNEISKINFSKAQKSNELDNVFFFVEYPFLMWLQRKKIISSLIQIQKREVFEILLDMILSNIT